MPSKRLKKGNLGLGLAYSASAALGLGGAVVMLCTFASATGVGLLLVLLAIGVAVLIEFIKDNPLQEWLAGSFFGGDTYGSLDAEMKALKEMGT